MAAEPEAANRRITMSKAVVICPIRPIGPIRPIHSSLLIACTDNLRQNRNRDLTRAVAADRQADGGVQPDLRKIEPPRRELLADPGHLAPAPHQPEVAQPLGNLAEHGRQRRRVGLPAAGDHGDIELAAAHRSEDVLTGLFPIVGIGLGDPGAGREQLGAAKLGAVVRHQDLEAGERRRPGQRLPHGAAAADGEHGSGGHDFKEDLGHAAADHAGGLALGGLLGQVVPLDLGGVHTGAAVQFFQGVRLDQGLERTATQIAHERAVGPYQKLPPPLAGGRPLAAHDLARHHARIRLQGAFRLREDFGRGGGDHGRRIAEGSRAVGVFGAPALRSLTPWPPLHSVERGNLAESICRIRKTSISGPSFSTKWRGTEGEASEGRTPQRARGVEQALYLSSVNPSHRLTANHAFRIFQNRLASMAWIRTRNASASTVATAARARSSARRSWDCHSSRKSLSPSCREPARSADSMAPAQRGWGRSRPSTTRSRRMVAVREVPGGSGQARPEPERRWRSPPRKAATSGRGSSPETAASRSPSSIASMPRMAPERTATQPPRSSRFPPSSSRARSRESCGSPWKSRPAKSTPLSGRAR